MLTSVGVVLQAPMCTSRSIKLPSGKASEAFEWKVMDHTKPKPHSDDPSPPLDTFTKPKAGLMARIAS